MSHDLESCKKIDLRGIPCPTNYVKCRLELEALQPNTILEILLDRGEPEEMVVQGLKEEGYKVEILQEDITWIHVLVKESGT